jgi:hypothetical protein
MPRFSLRTLILVMLLGGPVLAGLFAVPLSVVKVWQSRFPLRLQLVHQASAEVVRVEGAAVQKRWEAEWHLQHPESNEPLCWSVLEPNGNGAYELWVPSWGREDMYGREWNYGHFQALILKVTYADGTQAVATGDIPLRRELRDLVIPIPPH